MVRLLFLLGVVVAAFYIYSVVDCASFDHRRVRGLRKPAWIVVILVLPVIGGALWFLIGRGPRRGSAQKRGVAPDDDPDFLNKLGRDRKQEERIRRLEEELSRLEDKGDSDQPGRKDA